MICVLLSGTQATTTITTTRATDAQGGLAPNERKRRKATAAGISAAMTAFHEEAQSLGFLEQGQNKKSPVMPVS